MPMSSIVVLPTRSPGLPVSYRLSPGDDAGDGQRKPTLDPPAAAREDLPYRVELWDPSKRPVDQVLAVTASGSIGYAAFYGATREYPDRYITLRHKNSIISRWNGPTH